MKVEQNKTLVEILSNIKVPKKYYSRVTTGAQILDEAFGGPEMPGILPGASILLTGFPGAGKSTIALQMADLFTNEGLSVLYNCGEQNKYVVKMSIDRLGLSGNFAFSQFEDITDLTDYCRANNVDVLIQDSLQTLTHGDDSGAKLIKTCGNKLAKFASESDITTIIIGQITKGGDFAGPMQIKHSVDAHAHLSFNKDSGNRIFELTKNRFGPAMLPYEFFMSANGLDFRQYQDVEETKKSTRSSQKKEECCKKAKELLLANEKLSGYSFQENDGLIDWLKEEGYDISGGFWRGILAMAVKELEREGNMFKSENIKRREHVFLVA